MSLLNYNIFDEIKQRTDCVPLAQELGFTPNSSGMIRCFNPEHEDEKPSCKPYHNSFFCFGCGSRWSAIDIVMQVKSWDLLTASKWLADRCGIPWPKQSEEAQQEYEKKLNRQQEMEKRVIFWAKNLRSEDIEYFKKRGFAQEFIKEHCFGYCGQKMPQDLEAARELGLVITTKDGREWYMPANRLIIPFYRYGKVDQVAFHKPGGKPKYLYPAGWPKPLIGAVKRGEKPFLVEGVFCYYSLLQVELSALTTLGTQVSQEQKKELAKVGEFYICFDNEVKADGSNPGQEAALKLCKEFFPAARNIVLPQDKDVNDLLQELGQEGLRSYLTEAASQAINYLDAILGKLEQDQGNASDREEAMQLLARTLSQVEQEIKVTELAKLLKPLGIGKTVIRNEIYRIQRELKERAKAEEEDKDEGDKDIQHIASFPELVDVCESSLTGEPCFLTISGRGEEAELRETTEYTDSKGKRFYPPPREQMPWLLVDAGDVKRQLKNDNDCQLFLDLVDHFKGVSELPGDNYYKLLAWWTMHSYLFERGDYSPYIWLYAVPERGKSRTGKAAIYLAWRGVHVESLRDAYLVRIANNFGASLFFDCMDLWQKAEKQGTEDILLLRFERGARVARVIYPEKGAFKDTVYYKIFGPTVIATNKQVHNILETRTVQVNMPASSKRFETDIKPEDVLELKARLTAFRARHLHPPLPAADKPASGRLGDIMRPLLQIIRLTSPKEENSFKELLAEIEEARKLDKSSGQEAKIIQAIADLESEVFRGLPPLLPVKTVMEGYNEGVKEKYQLSSQGMGHRLKSLGFKKQKMGDGRMGIVWDEVLLEKLCFDYSLEDTLQSLRKLRNAQEASNHGGSQDGGFSEATETQKKPPAQEVFKDKRSGGYGDDGGFPGCASDEENKKNEDNENLENDIREGLLY